MYCICNLLLGFAEASGLPLIKTECWTDSPIYPPPHCIHAKKAHAAFCGGEADQKANK